MTVFTKNIDSLLSSGFFNKEHHNWVFTEKVALDKLDNLINHRYPILDGEIYNESFSLIWSWSCDRRRYENEDEYLKRSRNEAERNITDTQWLEGAKFFSFTPTLF